MQVHSINTTQTKVKLANPKAERNKKPILFRIIIVYYIIYIYS